eukprot:1756022-Pyramimonas_sp.AAC.1
MIFQPAFVVASPTAPAPAAALHRGGPYPSKLLLRQPPRRGLWASALEALRCYSRLGDVSEPSGVQKQIQDDKLHRKSLRRSQANDFAGFSPEEKDQPLWRGRPGCVGPPGDGAPPSIPSFPPPLASF